jgi:hypothetical protein
MKTKLLLSILALNLTACAAYQAVKQPGPADLTNIGIGTSRQALVTKLGPPKMIDTLHDGTKQDMFEFQSGMHQASKARAILYIAGDVFTLGLSELIFWPLELTVMDSATCTALATYDEGYNVKSWSVTDKNNSAQGC